MKLPWPWARSAALLSILLLFLSIWALAGPGKFASGGVPDWFAGKFGETFLASFPGLAAAYYSIAVGETLAAVLALAALLRLEFLPGRPRCFTVLAIVMSLLLFVQLGFGQRLTGDAAGAASLVFYFGATLVALIFVRSGES